MFWVKGCSMGVTARENFPTECGNPLSWWASLATASIPSQSSLMSPDVSVSVDWWLWLLWWLTDGQTDVCYYRVALATKNFLLKG